MNSAWFGASHGRKAFSHCTSWARALFTYIICTYVERNEGVVAVLWISLSALILQLPGEFHGGRSRRRHAGLPAQRAAHHHPPAQVHGADACDVPPGEAPQAGHHAAHGGGRRAGQPPHRSGTLWGSVPWVRGAAWPEGKPSTSFCVYIALKWFLCQTRTEKVLCSMR